MAFHKPPRIPQERVVAILADTSLVTQKQEVINRATEVLDKYKKSGS